jgi:hypothetical protein
LSTIKEQKASIIFTLNMSPLSPEFTIEKLNVSNNKAKYVYSMCFDLIYYIKRNMHFWKTFNYTQKSQNKNFI